METKQKMWWIKSLICASLAVFVFSGGAAIAGCPSADLTGDCFVNFEDFAVMAGKWLSAYDWDDVNSLATQWLTTDPCVSDDMVYIPDGNFIMGDHHGDCDGFIHELPLHPVFLDAFFMSKFEITNQQYCDYLNSAYDANDIIVSGGRVYGNQLYCDTHSFSTSSQIYFSGTDFSVGTKGGRDMSDDPMVAVSWYGAVAYCNWRSSKEGYESCYNLSTWDCNFSSHGYRLPTEAEWEYAARGGEHSPYYRFPWGDTISHSQANYKSYWVGGSPAYSYDVSPTKDFHPDWDDGIYPYTSVVGSFPANGYGLYDILGNVYEWCNDWYDENYYDVSPYDNPKGPDNGISHIMRGGCWMCDAWYCRSAYRDYAPPNHRHHILGFRVVLNLN